MGRKRCHRTSRPDRDPIHSLSMDADRKTRFPIWVWLLAALGAIAALSNGGGAVDAVVGGALWLAIGLFIAWIIGTTATRRRSRASTDRPENAPVADELPAEPPTAITDGSGMGSSFCPRCGTAVVAEDAKYCMRCGGAIPATA
jgi:hypothetical protein